jgi:murein DD-endopeptidase MepM/ murein hydrolase activator NlpD
MTCLIAVPWYGGAASAPQTITAVSRCDDGSSAAPEPRDPQALPKVCGYTALGNPAVGKTIEGTEQDPLSAFSRRPLDTFIIPEGGRFLDPLHEGPHYGVDYAAPEDYLIGRPTYVHPIGPGYVTARSNCAPCFVDGDSQGRVGWKKPQYNFGWGGLVLIETPYSANVSIYALYAHLNRNFVSLGDYVTPEDIIGAVGATGYAQELHAHLEIRYGPPGRFWNADFSQQETLDRWLATMFANPAFLVFPENHPSFIRLIGEWLARQPGAVEIP